MSEAHYHLVVNHFPIIGTIFGLGILIAGILFKNNTIKNVSYLLFIVAAIFAFLSLKTGGGAAGMVKNMPDISKEIIHKHAETADKLAIVLYVLAFISLLGLYTNIKNKPKAKLVSYLVLIIAAVGVYLAQQTGTTGGEIRHTEIRNNATSDSDNETEQEED
jgi:uncharacterized membrane protein